MRRQYLLLACAVIVMTTMGIVAVRSNRLAMVNSILAWLPIVLLGIIGKKRMPPPDPKSLKLRKWLRTLLDGLLPPADDENEEPRSDSAGSNNE